MADIGEKTYMATESSAQEILTLLDSCTTSNDLDVIQNALKDGITIEGNPVVGNQFSVWKAGKCSGSAHGTTYITVTGRGRAYLRLKPNTSSNACAAEAYISIDGNAKFRPYVLKTYGLMTIDFSQSIALISFTNTEEIYYFIGVE